MLKKRKRKASLQALAEDLVLHGRISQAELPKSRMAPARLDEGIDRRATTKRKTEEASMELSPPGFYDDDILSLYISVPLFGVYLPFWVDFWRAWAVLKLYLTGNWKYTGHGLSALELVLWCGAITF